MRMHFWKKSPGRALWSTVALLLLAIAPGCAGGEPAPVPIFQPGASSIDAPAAPALARSVVVGEFIAHVSPARRAVTFAPARAAAGPGLAPQSIDELNVSEDGVVGSGPASTVELVTNSVGFNGDCPVGYTTRTFCGNVTLRHFYPRSLDNVFVQVVSVYSPTDGSELTQHGGINGDASEFGLDATKGLWKYTAPAATTPGVLGTSPDNAGSRDWVFSDPDSADTYIRLRVVASLSYSDYTFDFSSQSFVDACATGTNLGKVSSATETMPFPFTLYGSTSSTVRFSKRGMLTFGNVNSSASGANLSLPNTSAPKPGAFVFWDDLGFNASSSGLCYATVGSAPNRQYVIEWQNMSFVPTADQPASLTFEAILSEGTNTIDMLYDTMTGPTSRADGDSATVGTQNTAGTLATGEFEQADFGSGNAYLFAPIP